MGYHLKVISPFWLQKQNKYIEEYLEGTRNETTVFCFLNLEIIIQNVLGVL